LFALCRQLGERLEKEKKRILIISLRDRYTAIIRVI
jgi:hypothetical protein